MGTPSSQSKIPRPILVLPGIELKAPRYASRASRRLSKKDDPQTLEQNLPRLGQRGPCLICQRRLPVAASSAPLITVAPTKPDGPWPKLREWPNRGVPSCSLRGLSRYFPFSVSLIPPTAF